MNFRGIRGNWGKNGELCFPNGETEFTDCEINFPYIREKGGNEGKLFHKNSPQRNLCETGWANEREMKGNFSFTTSFNCTVLYLCYGYMAITNILIQDYSAGIDFRRQNLTSTDVRF